jgi:hypothetical protein
LKKSSSSLPSVRRWPVQPLKLWPRPVKPRRNSRSKNC